MDIGNRYSYLLLNDVMRPDYRRSVITRALDFRKLASKKTRSFYNSVTRKQIKNVKGYGKDASGAPTSFLLEPTIKGFSRSSDVVCVILGLWLESETELSQKVEKFITDQKVYSVDRNLPQPGFAGYWSVNKMVAYRDQFLKEYPNENDDDVALMLCCLTSQAPMNIEDNLDIDEEQIPEQQADVEDETESRSIPVGEVVGEQLVDAGKEIEASDLDTPEADLEYTQESPANTKGEQETLEKIVENPEATTAISTTVEGSDQQNNDDNKIAEDTTPLEIEQIYSNLLSSLDVSRELLVKGKLDEFQSWTVDYIEQVRRSIPLLNGITSKLQNEGHLLDETIEHGLPNVDIESFLVEIRALINAASLNLPDQIEALKSIQPLKDRIEDYRFRRETILGKLVEANAGLARIKERAQLWKISEEKLEVPNQTQPVESASLKELEEAVEKNIHTKDRLEQEINNLRSSLIADIMEKCQKISVEIDSKDKVTIGDAFTKEIAQIQSMLTGEILDADLLLLPGRVELLIKRLSKTGISPEIVEAAETYLKDPSQYSLDYLLDALWGNGHFVEAFVLLTSGLRGMRWQSGKCLPENGLSNYFIGLLAITSPDELISGAIDLLADGLLASLVLFETPEEVMSMTMLYTSLMLARPGALPKDALWSFKRDNGDYIAPSWQRVADGLMQDNCPLIIEKDKLDFRELKKLENDLSEVFRREGGKYIHLVGAGSKTLRNMEQQALLPDLEGLWHNIHEYHPSHASWNNLRDKIESILVDEYFADFCHEHGLVADINPHFRKVFEDQITEILDLLKQYAELKEEAFSLTSEKPITWDDLRDELNTSRKIMGDSISQICEAAVREANQLDQQSQLYRSSIDGINSRICRALYTTEDLFYSLPYALDWIGRESLKTEKGWKEFFDQVINSLAKPVKQEKLVEFYVASNLPHIAESVAVAQIFAEGVRDAKNLGERINIELEDKETTLTNLAGELTTEETKWREENRYSLVLRSLGDRIESLQQQLKQREKEQREALKSLFTEVSELEPKLVEKAELPAVTRDEIFQALTAVRQVYFNSEIYRLHSAEAVLAEIRHLIDYPGADAEGLNRALEVLRNQVDLSQKRREDDGNQHIKDSDLNDILEHLLNGNWEQLNIVKDSLSEKQREDRAELIGVWERISGLPGEPSNLAKQNIDDLKKFSTLFAYTTIMYFGEVTRGASITHLWSLRPIPHFETKFIRAGTAALRNNIVLIFLTQSEFNRREFRELERIIQDEQWLKNGFFLVFVTPIASETVRDWVIRNYREKPYIVLDKEMLLDIVLSTDNPTATGRFRRILGRVAGPEKFDVFKYENLVDPDREIFVGRADQIRALVNSDQSHAIYGGRRIGKSSLLNAVDRELKNAGVKTAYISLEGPDVRDCSGVAVGSEILQKLGIGQSCTSLSDFKLQMTTFFIQQPDVPIVIFLDEVDRYIVARQHDKQPHDLIHIFRSLYQEHHGRCRFILAGFIEMWRHLMGRGGISGLEDPWFNFLQHSGPLEGLPSNDAQKIVREGFQEILGISFGNEAIPRKIVEATTGHPAFVQKFCERLHRHLFSQRSDEIREGDVQFVFDDCTGENYLGFVNYTLKQNLNPLPRLVVYLMAIEKRETFSADNVRSIARTYDEKLGEIEEITWANSMDELQITSVIKKTQTPNVYQFTVPSYQKILRNFELANQDVVYKLIRDITSGVMA